MHDNKLLGLVRFKIGQSVYTLQYTWEELAELESVYGAAGPQLGDMDILADVAAVGLRRRHPELDKAAIKKLSPPVFVLHGAVNKALRYAYYGDENPDTVVSDIAGSKKKRHPLRKFMRWLSATAWHRQNSGV